jgi:hypothetical protein
LFLLCLQPSGVTADELKYYEIEVVIFRNDQVPRSQEFNLPTPAPNLTEQTLDFSDPSAEEKIAEAGFLLLTKEDDYRLAAQAEIIDKSSRYELLWHKAWRQPGLESDLGVPVRVKAGRLFSTRYSSIDQFTRAPMTKDNTATDSSFTEGQPVTPADAEQAPPVEGFYELEGLITVTLSRYLHTHANLVLRKPVGAIMVTNPVEEEITADEPVTGQQLLNYSLNEQRRMRSTRLHYLDHPQFGMLVLITPYEPDESDEQADPEESTAVTAPVNG